MKLERGRHLIALVLVLSLAVVDSVSYVMSMCADLVIAALLYVLMIVGRDNPWSSKK